MLEPPQKTYFESKSAKDFEKGAVHLLGFRFDGTSCFRKGADLGPDAIRRVSDALEDYSPYLDRSLEDINLIDLGNLPHHPQGTEGWQKTTDTYFKILEGKSLRDFRLVTLGGEHSISYAPIVKHLETYPNLVLLHLDAHADLRDGYQGYSHSHASIIRRVFEKFGKGHVLIQYGIRSGLKEEFDWMKERKTHCHSLRDFLEKVKAIAIDRPIYLTLDLDYFDPGILPGTGTPEAGGEDFHSFISLVKILKNKNFIGADMVELAPELDPSDISACFAAKTLRELLLTLKN